MLLAVDTSTRMIGIALFDGSRVISQDSWMTQQHHTVELAQAVDNNLRRVGKTMSDLDALGVAIGPGSFTGLRIGMALMKGIAYHQQIPLVSIPTLQVLAETQPVREERLAVVLEAGRGRYAVGWYQAESGRWATQGDVENLSLEELQDRITGPTRVAGELSPKERQALSERGDVVISSPVESYRSPAVLAQLAREKWKKGDEDDPSTLSPIYLHRDQPIPS